MYLILTVSSISDENPIDYWVFKIARHSSIVRVTEKRRGFWVPVIEKVVLNLSDQQLLTGIAILIAGFWTHCSISVYHFFLVNDLAFFSSTAHLISLTVLQNYLKQNPALRNWRIVLMASVAVLLATSCVMQGHYAWFDSWSYDAQCLFDDFIGNVGGGPRYWMSVNLFLIGYSYSLSIITLYPRPTAFVAEWLAEIPKELLQKRIWRLQDKRAELTGRSFAGIGVQLAYCVTLQGLLTTVRLTHLMLIALITARSANCVLDMFWFAYSLEGLVGDRNIPASDLDGSESVMSFGQIVPILLLTSTVFVFGEAYVGKTRVCKDAGPADAWDRTERQTGKR